MALNTDLNCNNCFTRPQNVGTFQAQPDDELGKRKRDHSGDAFLPPLPLPRPLGHTFYSNNTQPRVTSSYDVFPIPSNSVLLAKFEEMQKQIQSMQKENVSLKETVRLLTGQVNVLTKNLNAVIGRVDGIAVRAEKRQRTTKGDSSLNEKEQNLEVTQVKDLTVTTKQHQFESQPTDRETQVERPVSLPAKTVAQFPTQNFPASVKSPILAHTNPQRGLPPQLVQPPHPKPSLSFVRGTTPSSLPKPSTSLSTSLTAHQKLNSILTSAKTHAEASTFCLNQAKEEFAHHQIEYALFFVEHALIRQPYRIEALVLKKDILVRQGKEDECSMMLTDLVKKISEHFERGIFNEQGIAIADAALALYPLTYVLESYAAVRLKVYILCHQKQFEAAKVYLDDQLRRNQDEDFQKTLLREKIYIDLASNNLQAAGLAIKSLLEKEKINGTYTCLLKNLYLFKIGRSKEACEYFKVVMSPFLESSDKPFSAPAVLCPLALQLINEHLHHQRMH